jgi:glutathione S-transferase
MSDDRRVLYRCRTPTNFLCPCGGVARDLKRRGLEFEQVRVALRKKDRADIAELTKQRAVPVLVDGDEIVNDSKRIHQWLEHAYED